MGVEYEALWTKAPISAVQFPTDGTEGALGISLSTSGWLHCWIDARPRMIWLPHERRSMIYAACGRRVALATLAIGTPTVLTFPTRKL
jgi:hypothetical protein